MRRLAPLLAALALAGCAVEPGAAPEPPQASTAPVASLAGHWRIAGIDGAPFNEAYGLALSGDAKELWWEPRCAGLVRRYAIDGSRIDFQSAIAPGGKEVPVCLIAPPPGLDEVLRALDSATTIARTPSNGIEISGGGRSVGLYSQ